MSEREIMHKISRILSIFFTLGLSRYDKVLIIFDFKFRYGSCLGEFMAAFIKETQYE